MEKKSKKNSHHIKKEKEESPDITQKTKIMCQSKTIKNFNKIKNFQKIVEDIDEYEIENESMKQMFQIDNGRNQINQIPNRCNANWKGMKSIYDNNVPQKNIFYSNLNKSNNNNSNNNSSVKNMKKNARKFPFSAVKKENQKYIMKNYITEKLSKNSKSNNNINISSSENYRIEKDNLVNNLNNIVIENKKKIKQNQGKLNNLIKLIKNKDKDPDNLRRNAEEKENFEKSKENMTQQVFRYTKKFPQKNNEINQSKIDKNELIQNLKRIQMKKQNTSKPNISSCNNFIINGLNQIYKKSFTKAHDNYILNDEDNALSRFNENNIYPNRLFSSTTNMKNSDSVNNMRIRISINDKNLNRAKKENIYVNKIKASKEINYSNIINPQIITDESSSIKIDNKINNLNYINIDSMNSNKNTIENNNLIIANQFQIHSPKSIYIPKKATSFRGMSQENIHNFKRKNDNPIIYHKKIESNNIYNNKYSNNNSKNENDYYFYFFNSEKRNSNKNSFTYKNNDYENLNNNETNLKRNGRATYSRKYSVKKQNYCWQNNNSFDDNMQNKNNYKKENNNSDNKDDFFNNINDVFENEIDDISSIKINSSYDSCTIDYENNINRIKFPFVNENENNTEKKKSQNNFQIYKNNGGNKDNINNFNYLFNNDDDFNNNIKMKKSIGTAVNNQNNINRIKVLLNQKKDKFNKGESNINNTTNKKSVRYNNRDKKYNDINYIPSLNIKSNDKNKSKDFYAATTSSFYNKKKNNVKDNNINQNDFNYKTQRNYYINKNKNKKLDANKFEKKDSLIKKVEENEVLSFELDDLVVLEEKFKNISSSIENKKPVYNSCFDFWNYFKNNCEILHNLNMLIISDEDLAIIKSGINYILMSIIFIFDYSYKQNVFNQISLFLKEMINFNYQNLLLIYEYLLENTLLSEIKNIWESKLRQIITNANLDKDDNTSFENIIINNYINNSNNNSEKDKTNVEKIKNNTNFIFQIIRIIIKNYRIKNSNILLYFFKEVHKKSSLKDFFYFFQTKILHSNGLFGYMSPQLVLKQNYNSFNSVNPPYIKSPSKKKFCLILSLEETLINFKFGPSNVNGISGVLRFRPGVNYFLSEMKKYFEVIVFSLYPQKIGDYLIDTLEKKEKYFDYRFFIQHSIVIENEFVKDLRRIGRKIDKMIIVDNLPQNYKLQKKNGINIKSYWEEDYDDVALGELAQILVNIIQNGEDVRNGIEKYRNEIIGKVTSKIDL